MKTKIKVQQTRKITPDQVRDIAEFLCEEFSNEGLGIHRLAKVLEDEGFRIHETFVMGALLKKNSGFILQDWKFWHSTSSNGSKSK